MLHNDRPKSLINKNNKRNQEEKNDYHPIDRILTGHYQYRRSPTSMNLRSNFCRTETNHIIQRQRVIRSFLNNKSDENEVSLFTYPTNEEFSSLSF